MFSGCFSAWRRSSVIPPPATSEQNQGVPPEASTSDYVQAPLHSSKATGISSAQRANATPSLPEQSAAAIIAGRRASNWEDYMAPETGETRSSASCIAGRRATDMDGPSSDRPAGPPPDDGGSRAAYGYTVTGADKQKMRNNVELNGEFSALPNITSRTFTFGELAAATLSFSRQYVLGEGGCGCVYKGCLKDGQHRQFVVEALMLSCLRHPNLVKLIGYCADGDQRLLVYEYMPLGSLEDHLHGDRRDREPIDWNTRMKIAAGAARGLQYLHDKANPPVIYRDFKPSNILLDEEYHPKLSDFGLAKLAPTGDKSHVSTKVRGTVGFWAPEYALSGHLTKKSDVYSFGVVLWELITGLTVIDNNRPQGQKNLVKWMRTLSRDRRELIKLADPRLQGQFPKQGLYGALEIAFMCIQENAADRPVIEDVADGLSYLADRPRKRSNPNAKCDRTRVEEVGGSGCK
ncbi:hypothetical protein Cgig2_011206 [Carnegiea gigantea]|uniref:Protein kinase domain-containing protein n=1 Tax=Carnegiea gigantea TaxID=171969 RepID=A0A9Q1KFA8_9CARY|nr:hypothetical protein Cgig2_011206 [Carnegiea gigantea]